MRAFVNVMLVASLVLWGGCQIDRDEPEENTNQNQPDNNDDQPPEQNLAQLERFASADELESYFKEQIVAQNQSFGGFRDDVDAEFEEDLAADEAATGADGNGGGDAAPVAPEATGGEGEGEGEAEGTDDSFSQTTTQEEGVDEADVVKTDGTYLYIMTGNSIQIVQAVPADDVQLMGSFPLEGHGQDLYLVGDLAVALTSTSGVFYGGGVLPTAVAEAATDDAVQADDVANSADADLDEEPVEPDFEPLPEPMGDIAPWFQYRPQTMVTIIDVTDRTAPVLASQTVFDGSLASSRMIDGVLRLVVANQPEAYYDVLPLGSDEDNLGLPTIQLDALLPDYQTTSKDGEVVQGNMVEWDDFYRPADPDGFGVTSIITLDTDAPDEFQALAVLAQPGLLYASTEALYLTDTDWYFDFRRVNTDIYKFAYTEDSVALVGATTVPGRVLNQYSMGEYDGHLRVATTTDGLFFWETGEEVPSTNNVYVVGEQDNNLAIVGSIEGLAPGEQIQSARFLGTRGYVVTFEQIDPLFTIDLTDPRNPQIVGEWHGPGFSTFIVPMDADHLLTVGSYVDPDGFGRPEGVQLSIFDVSNFADPEQKFNLVIGNSGTHSEATWNPKAFTYFASQGLLALPIEHHGFEFEDDAVFIDEDGGDADASPPDDLDGAASGGSTGVDEPTSSPRQAATPPFQQGEQFRGLFVYGVDTENGFDFLGSMSTAAPEEDFWYWWSNYTRGVFIEDYVYAVTNRMVLSAPLSEIAAVASQVVIPSDDFIEEPDGPGMIEPGVPEDEPVVDSEDGDSDGGGPSSEAAEEAAE